MVKAIISKDNQLELLSYLKLFRVLKYDSLTTVSAQSNYLSVSFETHTCTFRWSVPCTVLEEGTVRADLSEVVSGYSAIKKVALDTVTYDLTRGVVSYQVGNSDVAKVQLDYIVKGGEESTVDVSELLPYPTLGQVLRRLKPMFMKASAAGADLSLYGHDAVVYDQSWSVWVNTGDDWGDGMTIIPQTWNILNKTLAINRDTKYGATHDRVIAYTDTVQLSMAIGRWDDKPWTHNPQGEQTFDQDFDVQAFLYAYEVAQLSGDEGVFTYSVKPPMLKYANCVVAGEQCPIALKLGVSTDDLAIFKAWLQSGESVSVKVEDIGHKVYITTSDSTGRFRLTGVKV